MQKTLCDCKRITVSMVTRLFFLYHKVYFSLPNEAYGFFLYIQVAPAEPVLILSA